MTNEKLEKFVTKANSRIQHNIESIDKPDQTNAFIEAYVKENKSKLRKIASSLVVNGRKKTIVDMLCRELSNSDIYSYDRKVVEKSVGKIGIHSAEYLIFQLMLLFYIPMLVSSAMILYEPDLRIIHYVIYGLFQILFMLLALMVALFMYVCIEDTKFRLFRKK